MEVVHIGSTYNQERKTIHISTHQFLRDRSYDFLWEVILEACVHVFVSLSNMKACLERVSGQKHAAVPNSLHKKGKEMSPPWLISSQKSTVVFPLK